MSYGYGPAQGAGGGGAAPTLEQVLASGDTTGAQVIRLPEGSQKIVGESDPSSGFGIEVANNVGIWAQSFQIVRGAKTRFSVGSVNGELSLGLTAANPRAVLSVFGENKVLSLYGNATNAECALELVESPSDFAAPAASRVRIFARDNGAGKTQLVARFPTGAVQVLATEP